MSAQGREWTYPKGVGGLTATGYGRNASEAAQSGLPRARTERAPYDTASESMDKLKLTQVAALTVPIGGQTIDLQQVDYAIADAMSLLRVRIREGRRFTIFDIDPASARELGQALIDWAERQPGGGR